MRIGSSLSGLDLTTQQSLLRAFNQLNQSSVRLATMNRINSGSDDPAGLIAAENLRAELTAIEEASANAARARGVVRTADAASGQVLEARVRAGAFEKYTIDSSQRVLDAMAVNISSAFSQIHDTDVAAETSRLMRSEILAQSAMSSVIQAGRSRSLLGGLFGF